jgi:hypothetical protein
MGRAPYRPGGRGGEYDGLVGIELGTSSPGVLTFAGAPSSGTAIAADFSYYWPVRMSDDSVLFNMFLSQYYCKEVQLHQREELTRPPLAPAIRKGNI